MSKISINGKVLSDGLDDSYSPTKHELICWVAEYSYCKANGYPLNKGHTPPSMVYEHVEKDLEKWLEMKAAATNDKGVI